MTEVQMEPLKTRIEGLSQAPVETSQDIRTARGTPLLTFALGTQREDADWLAEMMFLEMEKHRNHISGPARLVWREPPVFTLQEDGFKVIHMQLAFEPVEPDDV